MQPIIAIPLLRGNYTFRNLNDILYIKIIDSICYIYFLDGTKKTSNKPLQHFVSILDTKNRFININRSLIINAQYIKEYDNVNQEIIIEGGTVLSLSRRASLTFKNQISKKGYIFKFTSMDQ